jgi:hypothetical protein
MKRFAWIVRSGFLVGVLTMTAMAQNGAAPKPFTYGKFSVPGAVILGVESITNAGSISGYYMDAAGNYRGFFRSSSRVLTKFSDPGDTQAITFTQGYQVNAEDVVSGQFFNSAANTYSGFFYNTATQTFTTYDVPDQPAGTITAVLGINSTGSQYCGYVIPPPYTVVSAFISVDGEVTIFSLNGSVHTECTGMNASGSTVGYYNDDLGASHSFIRNPKGVFTAIDYPGASTAAATLPCGGMAGGTVLGGISDRGDVSGHYWDAANNEHGFTRSGGGIYQHIDYPGAFQTAGGGINTHGTVVGYYLDSSCAPSAYIAYRPAGGH